MCLLRVCVESDCVAEAAAGAMQLGALQASVVGSELPVIVIDNGSSACRAGLSTDTEPVCIFNPTVYRLRVRKPGYPVIAVADEVSRLQQPPSAFIAKTPFDTGVACDFVMQVHEIDR